MQILTFTIALQDGTDEPTTNKLREKTFTILRKFMDWMGQEGATIGSSLETIN